MPELVSHAQFMVPAALSESPPLMVQQRAMVMKDVSEIIYQKLVKAIGTEMDYKTKIAGPSASGYASVLNPSFVSRSDLTRDEMTRKQQEKVMDAYVNYRASVDHMFETVNGEINKRFREAVDAKSEVYSIQMGKVLAFTGAMAELGAGVVGIAVFWMTGDPTVQRHLRGGDKIIAGGPINIAISRPTLKAALVQRLIQSGRTLVQADWDPAVLVTENDKNNLIIKGLQLPAYVPFATGAASHCDWIVVDGLKYLEVKVSTV
jgi:hypothetical protein